MDPAGPELLHPVFAAVLTELTQSGGIDNFRQPDGHVLIALDGTETFRSYKLHCPNCSHRLRSNGKTEYFHTVLGATLVSPGHNHVVPLEPEFVVPRDGAEKWNQHAAADDQHRRKLWCHRDVVISRNRLARGEPSRGGDRLWRRAADIGGEAELDRNSPPVMGSEDFAYMLEQVPGAHIGIGNGDSAGVHNHRYDFNDAIIPRGAALYAAIVEKQLPKATGG